MDPALGMHNIGNTGAGATDGKLIATSGKLTAFKIFFQRPDFILAVHHEFNVVSRCEPNMSITMLIRDLTNFPDKTNAHETRAARSDGIDFITGFRYMHQNPGL